MEIGMQHIEIREATAQEPPNCHRLSKTEVRQRNIAIPYGSPAPAPCSSDNSSAGVAAAWKSSWTRGGADNKVSLSNSELIGSAIRMEYKYHTPFPNHTGHF